MRNVLTLLFGILFSIITITLLHILINAGMAQEKELHQLIQKSLTNQTLQDIPPEGYRYVKGY